MTAAVLVAVLVGVTIAVQAATIAGVSDLIRPAAVSLALLAAGILVGGIWAGARGAWPEVRAVASHWWWLPLGAAGWLIVAALGWTAARLGVAPALSLVIGAQLLAALAIDALRGVHPVGPRTVAAGVLLLAALWLSR